MFKLTSDKIENDSINFQSHPLLLECANFDNISIFIENGASNKPYDDFPWLGLTIYHVANKSMVTKIRRLKLIPFRGLFYFKSNLWPFKKWSHLGPPFVFSNTNFTEKTVGFSWIRTWIVGKEGEHADHHHGPNLAIFNKVTF